MGALRTYKCNKCGYSALVSGGRDRGFIVFTNTLICLGCKEIVDVIVDMEKSTQINNISDNSESSDYLYRCPLCNKKSNLVPWDSKQRPCPKCNGKMEVDEEGEFLDWD